MIFAKVGTFKQIGIVVFHVVEKLVKGSAKSQWLIMELIVLAVHQLKHAALFIVSAIIALSLKQSQQMMKTPSVEKKHIFSWLRKEWNANPEFNYQ